MLAHFGRFTARGLVGFSCNCIVLLQSPFASHQHLMRNLSSFLCIDLKYQNGVRIHTIHYPPVVLTVTNPKCSTARPNNGERLSPRLAEVFSFLKEAKEFACLLSCLLRERRRLDFTVQPANRLWSARQLLLLVSFLGHHRVPAPCSQLALYTGYDIESITVLSVDSACAQLGIYAMAPTDSSAFPNTVTDERAAPTLSSTAPPCTNRSAHTPLPTW